MELTKLTQEEINKIIQETSPFGANVIYNSINLSRKDYLQRVKDEMMKELQRDKDKV